MNKLLSSYLLAALIAAPAALAADYSVSEGKWTLTIPEASKKLQIDYNGTRLFNDAYATVTYNFLGENTEYTISSANPATKPTVTIEGADDCFGHGKTYILSYNGTGAVMKQRLSFYPNLPYMIVQVSVESTDSRTVQSRSLTALAIASGSTPLNGASNKWVWVPFDNDGHLKYEVNDLKNNKEQPSHEVGYVFDGESRRGLIGGSVDHDTWKSAVTIAGTSGYKLEKFELLSGFTNYFTRDALPHGKVKGHSVASARFFVGLYEDWREGLNDYAEANSKVAPRLEWADGNPIGWSSWGVQQNYINYDGVLESAQFMKENLYDLGFHDSKGRIVISLDAFSTDNISAANLYKLGTKIFCDGTYRDGRETKEGMNMILGQYGGHLIAWGWSLDSKVSGTGLNGTPDYIFRDMALKVNGDVHKLNSNGGYAVDPTHPAVRANLEFAMKQYAANGTKYVKMDFLNGGSCEGDSWYDPEVTTGIQAYNYGMKMLREEAAKYGMYVVESISPTFPYQYAHGRRTCCDRFSQIGESEYVMNAISYGWWTDRLYTVNDPDQLVMCKGGYGAKETIGENRARATSGMATGAYIFGDNFCEKVVYTDSNDGHTKGAVVGYPEESRKRALEIMGNADINDYVRNNTGSFIPVDGHKPSSGQSAESIFVRRSGNSLYVAVFNYQTIFAKNGEVEYSRLGIGDADEITEIKELWTGESIEVGKDKLSYSVPAKDARVYRFSFYGDSGVGSVVAPVEPKIVSVDEDNYTVSSAAPVRALRIVDLAGRTLYSGAGAHFSMADKAAGIYIVEIAFVDGSRYSCKLLKK